MIPRAHILAWRLTAPWISDAQVEQDLVLSRAIVEIFSHPALSKSLALRGGTSFNKFYAPHGSRYSEDIDLVQTKAEPIGEVLDAIRALLDPWLGPPQRKAGQGNATLRYRYTAEDAPGSAMRLKVEINTREHFTVFGYAEKRFAVESPWFSGRTTVRTYDLDELLGTKLRALYQRKKGRDLFDLWRGLGLGANPARVVQAFRAYMKHGGLQVSGVEYEANLSDKMKDKAFVTDIRSLLAAGLDYDPGEAEALVRSQLVARLF